MDGSEQEKREVEQYVITNYKTSKKIRRIRRAEEGATFIDETSRVVDDDARCHQQG